MTKQSLMQASLAVELWREYDFAGRIYRINNPHTLFYRPGGETHRIVDAEGVVHCAPAPGKNGCVLRWKNRAGTAPVCF